MTEQYILEVDIDNETGEEHCTVLKTDGTTNMANWIEIVSAMYTHHSILEPLVNELNKIQNNYNNTEKCAIKLYEENEQLKQRNDRQAKQLDRLYHLIEEKDWIALSDIIDDFKQCEEQLQKEWGTYCDFE